LQKHPERSKALNQSEDLQQFLFEDDAETDDYNGDYHRFSSAVVYATDWTAETLVNQISRQNIAMNPRFQRRDAWDVGRKSRFIESLVLGLPVPQIVLAEDRSTRGRYLVLDGKQRLLSLLQFWGLGSGSKNAYGLSGLSIRKDLTRRTHQDFATDPNLADDLRALDNQSIRTVIIRNWPDQDFLHLLFLRLNTGSTKLSPQELRQALMPGPYSDYVDDRASASQPLQSLLGLSEPDYRMRDVELLARHIAFTFFMPDYPGRMKEFLDYACSTLNEKWDSMRDPVEQAVLNFEAAIKSMVLVFGGEGNVARKPGSRIINRTIFDTLALYFSREEVREYAESNIEAVNLEYERLFLDRAFVSSVDRDTASPLNITYRIKVMGQILDPSLPVVES
jgi:hypothetical protein